MCYRLNCGLEVVLDQIVMDRNFIISVLVCVVSSRDKFKMYRWFLSVNILNKRPLEDKLHRFLAGKYRNKNIMMIKFDARLQLLPRYYFFEDRKDFFPVFEFVVCIQKHTVNISSLISSYVRKWNGTCLMTFPFHKITPDDKAISKT